MNTDRIEKKILLRAPLGRVWRALTSTEEFGDWFGMKLEGKFVPGAAMRGVIVGTTVNPEIAKAQQQYAGKAIELTVERMDPERLFSFRWHPHATDPKIDYAAEPTTLVEFVLEPVPEGVMLTVTESGFDQIPLARRATAFAGNEQGWALVITLIRDYLVQKG